MLAAPDFQKPFILYDDASDLATGAALLQKDGQGVLHPITTIKMFQCYLYGSAHPVQILTDYNLPKVTEVVPVPAALSSTNASNQRS